MTKQTTIVVIGSLRVNGRLCVMSSASASLKTPDIHLAEGHGRCKGNIYPR